MTYHERVMNTEPPLLAMPGQFVTGFCEGRAAAAAIVAEADAEVEQLRWALDRHNQRTAERAQTPLYRDRAAMPASIRKLVFFGEVGFDREPIEHIVTYVRGDIAAAETDALREQVRVLRESLTRAKSDALLHEPEFGYIDAALAATAPTEPKP